METDLQKLTNWDLVLVGDFANISEWEKYRVERVAEIFPQMHNGNPFVRIIVRILF